MIFQATRIICAALGVTVASIGASIFVFGPAVTAESFASVLAHLLNSAPVAGFEDANTDSELRFYSVFLIAYGVALVNEVLSSPKRGRMLYVLILLFFLGGVGRLLSWKAIGTPHVLFQILLWIELVLPVLIFAALVATRPDKIALK